MLPKVESPVTRQEKMATVWDEAEVRAVRAGSPGAGARGETLLAGGKAVPGGQGLPLEMLAEVLHFSVMGKETDWVVSEEAGYLL